MPLGNPLAVQQIGSLIHQRVGLLPARAVAIDEISQMVAASTGFAQIHKASQRLGHCKRRQGGKQPENNLRVAGVVRKQVDKRLGSEGVANAEEEA